MKKLVLLLPICALAACDNSTSNAELICNLDKNWQMPVADVLDDTTRADTVNITMTAKTYDKYAKLIVNGKKAIFKKVSEEQNMGQFGLKFIHYKGVFPDSKRNAEFSIVGDITNKRILQYNITFDGQQHVYKNKVFDYYSWGCTPVNKDYIGDGWGAAVPFKHHYKMPNKTESCITKILELVQCETEKCDSLSVFSNETGQRIVLSQSDALFFSPNWDYSNMKLYKNDGKLEQHERDACAVLERLKTFLYYNSIEPTNHYNAIKKAKENCGKKCEKILTRGERGDYVIKVPETPVLHKITKDKNTRFISVFNPNFYAENGYCLVNVIPPHMMSKLKMKKPCYRIYCGVPESVNYDKVYASEICEE